jgi:hypothetical protein
MAQQLPSLIRIHAEKPPPSGAFATIKFCDYWYWIDKCGFKSKATFTFLMRIMTLVEKEEKFQSPIVTIQAN